MNRDVSDVLKVVWYVIVCAWILMKIAGDSFVEMKVTSVDT